MPDQAPTYTEGMTLTAPSAQTFNEALHPRDPKNSQFIEKGYSTPEGTLPAGPAASFTALEQERFEDAYVDSALATLTDDNGVPLNANYELHEISPASFDKIKQDLSSFTDTNREDIQTVLASGAYDIDTLGADFWHTRNHLNPAFADRQFGDVGDRLTESALRFPENTATIVNGQVHIN